MSSSAELELEVPTIGPDDELLSLSEAARETRLSKQTLLLARMKGRLPMREAAGRFLIRRRDLDAFKRQRARDASRKGRSA